MSSLTEHAKYELERAAGTTETTYTSHYATCPDADRFRKR